MLRLGPVGKPDVQLSDKSVITIAESCNGLRIINSQKLLLRETYHGLFENNLPEGSLFGKVDSTLISKGDE